MRIKRSKEKPVKLGQIYNGELEKTSKAVTWNLDVNICIFLRDTLKFFKNSTEGMPVAIYEKYKSEENQEEKAIAEWNNILQQIIDGFDYYLKGTQELLPEEEQKALQDYYNEWWKQRSEAYSEKKKKIKRKKSKEIAKDLVDEITNHYEMPPEIREIVFEHEAAIAQKQREKLNESFDLLKTWIDSLWW